MAESKTREPVQQRSIEKKKKILDVGFELFCEKGYHNTNTAEIAKKAGVSTGIVYNYFHNKKEIFMECLDLYVKVFSNPIYMAMEEVADKDELIKRIGPVIDMAIKSHNDIKTAHEEMQAMVHFDQDVAAYFKVCEEEMMARLVAILQAKGVQDPHVAEKLHIVLNMIEDVCHEIVFHQHDNLDYEFMKQTVVDMVTEIVVGLS